MLVFAPAIYSEESVKKEETPACGDNSVVYFLPHYWSFLGPLFEPETVPKMAKWGYNLQPFIALHALAGKEGMHLREAKIDAATFQELGGQAPVPEKAIKYICSFDVTPEQIKVLKAYPKEKRILFLWEPPTTIGLNYNTSFHEHFSKVFTWRDDLVDNKTYFKIHYPVLREMISDVVPFKEKKLCTIIAACKYSSSPNELYSERRKTIDFFEAHHPDEFDLYGGGWPEKYQTFRGLIDFKVDYLKKYKFAIAYENGRDIPGYVTEKMFDCFHAGCIPIYWGASNVTDYVPQDCFIARQDFASNEELYTFMKNMPEEEYLAFLGRIRAYLKSDRAQVFSGDHFVKEMMRFFQNTTIPTQSCQSESKLAEA